MQTSNQNSAGVISYNSQGQAVGFEGAAVNIYRAALLASSLKLYDACKICPTRGVGPQAMLKMATGYTGQKYKRGQYVKAAADLSDWIIARKAVTPTETRA